MVLILYLTINDLNNYRKEFIECLTHNSEIPSITKILVFCEASFQNLPIKNKISYWVKKNYSEVEIIEYVKKLEITTKRFIWSNPFVYFNIDLLKIKNDNKIYRKKDEFIVFNRDTVIRNGLESIITNEKLEIKTRLPKKIDEKLNNRKKSIIKEVNSKIKKLHTKIDKKINYQKNSKLDIILVSVNYNQYLEKTLEHNTKIFSNINVVTHISDKTCIDLCNKYNVNCITEDDLYKDGTINKSIGLNKAIKSLVDPDWILIIDADIIINKEIDIKSLNIGNLYTSSRYICEDMYKYEMWKNREITISEIGKLEADRGIGFFQLFNYAQKKSYPDSNYGRYSESTWSDIIFKQGFKNRETLNLDVIHLGKPYQKWKEIKVNDMKESNKIDSIIDKKIFYKIHNRFHILIPIYNFESYLKECIESILLQNYENWICYLFDDGSTDSSNEICLYYVSKYKDKFEYIKKGDINNGPAYTKFYGMKEIEKKSNPNDIFMVVDGDDSLLDENALNIINETYLNKKCWVTYGSFKGKWQDQSMDKPESGEYRKETWRYSHPRTFKCGLINNFEIDDFKMNGKWLTKGTDRPMVYNVLELSGNKKIQYIKDIIYNYREHDKNTYKIINKIDSDQQKKYVDSLTPNKKIKEDIDIVMCSWKRTHVLKDLISSLESQTVSSRIVLHIINNNKNEYSNILNIIKGSKIRINLINSDNSNYAFERFIYVNKLLSKKIIDYVIFIDDDQYFAPDQIENLYNIREPETMVTWYGKVFNTKNIKYWTDTKHCYNNTKQEIKEFDYGGTGFSIIDCSIFDDNSELFKLYEIEGINIKKIEDLWLSYIIKVKYGWKIKRSFLPPNNFNDEKTVSNSLYLLLKNQKQDLLEYLIKRGWEFKK